MGASSQHEAFPGSITTKKDGDKEFLVVNGMPVRVFHEKDPASIPWGEVSADYVCESTGVFTTQERAESHQAGGALCVCPESPKGPLGGCRGLWPI